MTDNKREIKDNETGKRIKVLTRLVEQADNAVEALLAMPDSPGLPDAKWIDQIIADKTENEAIRKEQNPKKRAILEAVLQSVKLDNEFSEITARRAREMHGDVGAVFRETEGHHPLHSKSVLLTLLTLMIYR